MATPLLTYAIVTDPFPLQASPAGASPAIATLTLVATNSTAAAVSLQWLSVKFPVGAGAQQLTTASTAIGPVPPDGWKNQKPQTPTGFVIFGFEPASAPAPVSLPPGGSLVFTFNDIEVNTAPGTVEIDVTEGSTDSPVQPLFTTKFPAGWGNVDFWVDPPNITAGQSTTLHWDGPSGATYTIEYTQNSVVVNIPAQGQPALGNQGVYPGQGQPALVLNATTVFTLSVSLSAGSQNYEAQLQKTVTVAQALPVITSFTGTLTAVGNQVTGSLNWTTDADNCTLSGNADILKASGTFPLAPSASTPLLTLYTLTASNTAGSVTSTLAVVWGIKTSAPAHSAFDVQLSPDQSRVYVVNGDDGTNSGDGMVTMFDRATLQIIGSPVKMGIDPVALAVSPDGTRAYVSNDASYNVNAIDTSSGQLALLGSAIPVGTEPMMLTITPDGSKVLAGNVDDGTVSVLATSSDPNNPLSALKTISLGVSGMGSTVGLAVSPDGKKAYAGTASSLIVIDLGSLALAGAPGPLYSIPQSPASIAVTPDSSHVFAGVMAGSGDSAVLAFQVTADPANPLKAAGEYDTADGLQAVAAAPGSQVIYVVTEDDNLNGTLTIVDIATMQPVSTPVGGLGLMPTALAVSDDGTNIYVASGRDGNLWSLMPVSFSGGTAAAASRRSERSFHGCG